MKLVVFSIIMMIMLRMKFRSMTLSHTLPQDSHFHFLVLIPVKIELPQEGQHSGECPGVVQPAAQDL